MKKPKLPFILWIEIPYLIVWIVITVFTDMVSISSLWNRKRRYCDRYGRSNRFY